MLRQCQHRLAALKLPKLLTVETRRATPAPPSLLIFMPSAPLVPVAMTAGVSGTLLTKLVGPCWVTLIDCSFLCMFPFEKWVLLACRTPWSIPSLLMTLGSPLFYSPLLAKRRTHTR